GEREIEAQALALQEAARGARLLDAYRREVHVDPAGKAVLAVPQRLAVAQQHELVHALNYNVRPRVKFVQENILLIVVALVSGAMLLWPYVRRATTGRGVSTAQATHLINREDALVLDVRDPGEYGAGHILGAKNVPVARIDDGSQDLPKKKERQLIVYCDGTGRSAKAAAALKRQGFTRVASLSGGLKAWQQAGLPVVK